MKIDDFKKDPKKFASQWIQSTLARSPGAIPRVARAIGKSQDLIYSYADQEDLSNNLHLYNLPILFDETADLTILDELNAMFGRISLPANGNTIETIEALLKALKTNGG
jgi:hypothetical protein